jgi:hypothetical protein
LILPEQAGRLNSDEDPEEVADEGERCPICKARNAECNHLLANVDITDGAIYGGAFYHSEDEAVDLLNGAVLSLLWAVREGPASSRRRLPNIQPYRLADLVERVWEEIGEALGAEDMRTCSRAFVTYLDDLFQELPGVLPTYYDSAGPGCSESHCCCYWAKAPEKAVKQALAQIAAETTTLRRLSLLLRALEMIRGDFTPQTWQAFWRVRVDGQTPAVVADELGMTANAVRGARGRVLRRLREELGHLAD